MRTNMWALEFEWPNFQIFQIYNQWNCGEMVHHNFTINLSQKISNRNVTLDDIAIY